MRKKFHEDVFYANTYLLSMIIYLVQPYSSC